MHSGFTSPLCCNVRISSIKPFSRALLHYVVVSGLVASSLFLLLLFFFVCGGVGWGGGGVCTVVSLTLITLCCSVRFTRVKPFSWALLHYVVSGLLGSSLFLWPCYIMLYQDY